MLLPSVVSLELVSVQSIPSLPEEGQDLPSLRLKDPMVQEEEP